MSNKEISLQKEKKRKTDWQIQHEKRLAKAGVYELQKLLISPSGLVLNNNIKIPNWKNLTKTDKMFGLFMFIINGREYCSFTLRFSHKFMKKTKKCKKKLTVCVSERIRQNLENNLGYAPLFLMVAEYDRPKSDEDSSFHVHGVIRSLGEDHIFIKNILKSTAFGRHFKDSRMNCNIIRIKPLYTPIRWLEYITKTKQAAYESIYVSRELNAQYRQFYNSVRKEVLKKKGL